MIITVAPFDGISSIVIACLAFTVQLCRPVLALWIEHCIRSLTSGTCGSLWGDTCVIILKYFEENPAAILSQARTALYDEFVITITLSGLHSHRVKKCCLMLKKLKKIPIKRNCLETLELRCQKIIEWQSLEGFDYISNCVFIDEVGFNMHIKRTLGRSVRGNPEKAAVPTQHGITLTIIGAICEVGVANLVLKKPQAVVSKKRKAVDGKSREVNGRIGTQKEHYLESISSTMDVLDQSNMKECYLVMDNAPIHKSETVRALIESKKYKCVYLPTYSPFLNPIEEFWSKV